MSRSSSVVSFLALTIVTSFISESHGQPEQPGRRRPRGRFVAGLLLPEQIDGQFGADRILALLGVSAVERELALSDEDKRRAARLARALREEQRETMQHPGVDSNSLRQLRQEERDKRMKEARDAQAKLDEKYLVKVSDMLKPEQFERLKQIEMQALGALALGAEQVGSQLKLSDEQKTEISKIITDSMTSIRHSIARGKDESREDFQARMEEIRKAVAERDTKLLAELSEDQRKQFDELNGKPFDVSALGYGFGGGYIAIEGPGGGEGHKAETGDRKTPQM
jgi:hypothetical protein